MGSHEVDSIKINIKKLKKVLAIILLHDIIIHVANVPR